MIPKNLHQIWVGPNEVPNNCLKYVDSWKKNNSDYNHFLWTNENLPKLPDNVKEQYERYGELKKYAFQADVLRYYLIFEYGGVYVDIDIECHKKIDELLQKDLLISLVNMKAHWIANSFFGAIKAHYILEYIIKNMKKEAYHGPIFFGNIIKKFLGIPIKKEYKSDTILQEASKNKNITCLRPEGFFNNNAKNRYGTHHALKSWIEK